VLATHRRPSTLPATAAVGAIVVLTVSLLVSKAVLDALVDFEWPVAVYVVVLAVIGYGPSIWWCRLASRRWGEGHLGPDIGLTPRWSDLAWGPVVWLGAIGAQIAAAAVVVGLGVPISSNTEAINEVSADRTYVVAIVITAVLAAPVVEEMVFRGVVMRGLDGVMPMWLVVPVQGILFGAAHVDPVRGSGNLGLVIVLSGVGIAFGVATALFGRLGPAIVAHALFNGVVLLVVLTGLADRLQDSASNAMSIGQQIDVVDQSYLADAYGEGEPASTPCADREPVDVLERVGVEQGHVVERCERLRRDHVPGGCQHGVGTVPALR
jgi:hypothetical protein